MAEGVDISEHQGVWQSWQFDPYDFAILRAFNEWGNRDKVIDQTWANAAGHTLRGVYGWPIPGRDNHALGVQLVTSFPGAEAGYWCDREISGAGIASAGEVEDYMRGIFGAGGFGGFYSNIPECPRTPWLDTLHWWMADYTYNNGQRQDPYQMAPRPDRPYTIHQYSSAGGLDLNWSENLDWLGNPPPMGEDDELNDLERGMLKDVWERTKNMWDGVPGYGVEAWPTVTEEIEQTLAKVNTLGGDSGGAPDITQVPDAELVAETNRRIAAGTIAPSDVTVVDV